MSNTVYFYTMWSDAIDFFNRKLFGGELERVMFTVEKTRSYNGYFHANQWHDKESGQTMHQITMDADALNRNDRDTMGTLVHEMAHLWERQNGVQSKTPGYHAMPWAEKMLEIGLKPRSLDRPGTMVGRKVTHDIVDGGAFDVAFTEWSELEKDVNLAGVSSRGLSLSTLPGLDELQKAIEKQKVAKRKSKTKYTCSCGTNIWGKPGLRVTCDECGQLFEEH